ncbi:PREDICTED: C-type lectin domain family 4 member M-like [Branchiostoma belcheri]|uniref:C-type lectin domain family 4 member M-like n=1 Tax=Branchiostoma belcheri TaxID=7741 RepID=A0A6P4XJT5_BRABE|nr:PREDICTED: C-type lectin domain family 4 member M-like [Branchiostoma belcheri]
MVIRTLCHRANTIVSDPQDLETEKSHLTQALKTCGYPQWAINKATCPKPSNTKPSAGSPRVYLQACPDGWTRNKQSCYLLVDTPKTWQDARDACHQLQADLASLTTADEQTYMAAQVDDTYWFGLSDIVAEDDWQWEDGTNYDPTVTNWNSNEPNNMNDEDCAEIGSHAWGWNDQACTDRNGYICEIQTD